LFTSSSGRELVCQPEIEKVGTGRIVSPIIERGSVLPFAQENAQGSAYLFSVWPDFRQPPVCTAREIGIKNPLPWNN
jgi:hypothetical protein